MMKKISSVLLIAIILLSALVIPVHAVEDGGNGGELLYYERFFNWLYPNYAEIKEKHPDFDPHPVYEELYYHQTDGAADWVLVKGDKGIYGEELTHDVLLGRYFSDTVSAYPFKYRYGVYDVSAQAFYGLEEITDSSKYPDIVDVLERLNIGKAITPDDPCFEPSVLYSNLPEPTVCGDYSYYRRKDGDAVLTKYTGTEANVIIPEKIDGYKIVETFNLFVKNPNIESITIPKGIRCFNSNTVYACENLKTVYYNAEYATTVENSRTFGSAEAGNVEKVIIGNNVKWLTPRFLYGTKVTELEIPSSVTYLPDRTFTNCNLTKLTIPDSVTRAGEYLFYEDYNLTEVTVGNGVSLIDSHAFWQCKKLKKITLGSNVHTIGVEAFNYCEALTDIALPDSLRVIDQGAFNNCVKLETLTFPENLEEIRKYAFYHTPSLKKADLNKNLKVLEEWAFYDSDLEEVTLPEAITRIEAYTFAGMDDLKTLTIPEFVTFIGSYAFSTSHGLTEVTLPDNEIETGVGVFSECDNLKTIHFGKNTESIGDSMFAKCTSLRNITLPDSLKRIENNAFKECTALTSLKIPESVDYIGNSCFSECRNLVSVNIPQGVGSIGSSCFYNCRSLKEITLPDSVTEIRCDAFRGCRTLTAINIPDSVIKVGLTAFYDCGWYNEQASGAVYAGKVLYTYKGAMPEDTSLTVREGTKALADYALNALDNLIAVTLPDSVEYIGAYAFRGTAIKSIKLPPKVTTLETSVFQYCKSLESLTITPAITKVEKYALNSCTSLQSVTVQGDITRFDITVFQGSYYLKTLYGYVDSYAHSYAKYKKWTFIPLNAMGEPNELCDVNADGHIDINDATAIQRHLAGLTLIHEALLPYADSTKDNELTINDATAIQRKLAGYSI